MRARILFEQAHHDALTVNRRHGADAHVDPVTSLLDLKVSVLGYESLGDVPLRHDLETRDQRRVQIARGRRHDLEHTVDAVPEFE